MSVCVSSAIDWRPSRAYLFFLSMTAGNGLQPPRDPVVDKQKKIDGCMDLYRQQHNKKKRFGVSWLG